MVEGSTLEDLIGGGMGEGGGCGATLIDSRSVLPFLLDFSFTYGSKWLKGLREA
jgi:hypothetical protein